MAMTTENSEKSAEFTAAMRAFSRLADKHGLQLSTEQKKIFWSGVLYGVRRARGQQQRFSEAKATKGSIQRKIDTAPLLDKPTEPDIHQGGAFQL